VALHVRTPLGFARVATPIETIYSPGWRGGQLWGDDRGWMNSFTFDDEWGVEGFNVTSGLEMGNKRLAGMKPNAPFKLHTDWITKVMYLSHSGCIVTSSMDSSLRMVDLERKKLKWCVSHSVSPHSCLAPPRLQTVSCCVSLTVSLTVSPAAQGGGGAREGRVLVRVLSVAQHHRQLRRGAADHAVEPLHRWVTLELPG
jgi:hypothetical protein